MIRVCHIKDHMSLIILKISRIYLFLVKINMVPPLDPLISISKIQRMGLSASKKNCGGFNLIRFHFLIRYIIGIDGLETTRYWDDLLRAFPDDNMSSRIIVTTRKDEIADTCHKNCPVYRMRPTLDTKAPQAELVQILCEGTARKRRVVTVFGPGGSGKSILARAAYDQLTEMEHFLHKAWAMASHDNGKGLLLDILGQLGKTNVREENISQLIDILRGLLLNGRCVLLPSLLTSTDNKPMIIYRLVHLFKRNTCCKSSNLHMSYLK